ncbi:zinc finger protein 839-like [Denticeps clupeoides]|uniref:zinc finger protein 839-like n=1 Tax=Denticeps clupeoides TaxID=299321 RepID=UPI0010A56435|nr:zinc finger protein 839-like [Denticeps clupeoides]
MADNDDGGGNKSGARAAEAASGDAVLSLGQLVVAGEIFRGAASEQPAAGQYEHGVVASYVEAAESAVGAATTIIYVQPDGSFVEGSGLTAEEQKQLVEQLAQQQLVPVSESEAARIFEQSQAAKPPAAHGCALAPVEVQQVIEHVSKSQQLQQHAAVPVVHNASQRLQSVAKQVALQQSQNGTRVAPQKPVETIHIQVQVPVSAEASETLLQSKPVVVTQAVGKATTGVAVSSPQIIHITPLPGQQQYFLQSPGEPPIQLLLQRPTPVVSNVIPVLQKPVVQTPVNGAQVSSPVPAPPPVTTPPRPAQPTVTPTEEKKPKGRNRSKKPQKVQTRSGRVSRPPKHKVKDYKFIKTEDLADSHQSDSDDYSEISVDEEEEAKRKVSDVNFNLTPKAFKCETCDKSYIGLGGLSRHYKLNPSHGSVQISTAAPCPAAKILAVSERGGAIKSDAVAPQGVLKVQHRGPGIPRGPGRPGRPRIAGRPRKRGRPGRPPKPPGDESLEQQALRRRARLREVVQHCDNEDLVDVVLPRLARVTTLWDFVLLKVERGRHQKAQFSEVYQEFEQLHAQVKKMAQEHTSGTQGLHTSLEVHNMEVLKSLGIMEHPAVVKTPISQSQQAVTSAAQDAAATKRLVENTKMLPPAKRFKMENCSGETNGYQINHNSSQKKDVAPKMEEAAAQTGGGEKTSVEVPPQKPLVSLSPLEAPAGEGTQATESDATDRGESGAEISEVSQDEGTTVDVAEQMQELEQALISDLEPAFSSDTHQIQQETAARNDGGAADQQDGGRVETSEVKLEHTYVQTEGGGLRLASEGIVTVNEPGGTGTINIQAPQGVALETVLLAVDTGGAKSEGVVTSGTQS